MSEKTCRGGFVEKLKSSFVEILVLNLFLGSGISVNWIC